MTTPASAERLPVLLSPGPRRDTAAERFGGRFAAPVTYAVFGLLNILVFGAHAHGDATLSFTPEFAKVSVPNLSLAAAATCYACGLVSIALAVVRLLDVLGIIHLGRVWRRTRRRTNRIAGAFSGLQHGQLDRLHATPQE